MTQLGVEVTKHGDMMVGEKFYSCKTLSQTPIPPQEILALRNLERRAVLNPYHRRNLRELAESSQKQPQKHQLRQTSSLISIVVCN